MADFSNFSPQKIAEEVGEEWIKVAKQGLIHLLEKPNVLLCKSEATNDTDYYAVATMIDQSVNLQKESIQHLSENAIKNAIAAITWELNSPPDWVNKLIRYHEADVKSILKIQLFNEATTMESNKYPIHQFARYGKTELGRICLEIVNGLIERKIYTNIDALVDASEIAARSANDSSLFNPLYEMYKELPELRSDLAANIITISPEEGLSILSELNNDAENKEFLKGIISCLIKDNTSREKLKRIFTDAEHLTNFVRIVLSVTPEGRSRISEGVTHVTPESEVLSFKNALYSMVNQLPYEVAKQFVYLVSQDPNLKLKMPWISRIEYDVIENETNQPLSVERIESWIGGHWAKNIRTVGQLHSHITSILGDIYHHVISDDFSSEPLWSALVKRKAKKDITKEQETRTEEDQKDRTLEEHAQVWLANELRYRSKGIYTVKREDQSINSKRRDITVSIPAVGSCIIEIKIANKKNRSYTYDYFLSETINKQIIQYISDEEHRAAILLLFATNPKRTKLPEGGYGTVSDVAKRLQEDDWVDGIKGLERFTVYPFVVGGK